MRKYYSKEQRVNKAFSMNSFKGLVKNINTQKSLKTIIEH